MEKKFRTNIYASFKGKLKVGDKVRLSENCISTITRVDEDGFNHVEDEIVNGWKAGGRSSWSEFQALELLDGYKL